MCKEERKVFWFQLYSLTHKVAMEISSLLKAKEISVDKECKPKQNSKEVMILLLTGHTGE